MNKTKIKFGTEGWRAIMADTFTMGNVRIVSQAIAEYARKKTGNRGKITMAVGYDTRFLSPQFAAVVSEVLAANNIRVILASSPIPTCAVSAYVVGKKLPLGVMVTASHNPGLYNGIKIKEDYGGSVTSETVAFIESRLGCSKIRSKPIDEAKSSKFVVMDDMLPRYLQGIRSFIDLRSIKRAKFKIIADPMYGTAGRLIETLLSGGKTRVETIHGSVDPYFGGRAPEPISANLKELQSYVRKTRADIGIANDGDADRIGIVSPSGQWINPGQVMCVLLWHLVNARKQSGAVIKTVSNTMMIDHLTAELGLPMVEVPVGFKHVAKLMLEQDVLIGGEESGGIGLKGYLPERDGIVNGLLLLEAMAHSGKKLSALMQMLEERYGRWYYGRRDLHLAQAQVDRLFRRLESNTPNRMAGISVARVNRLDGIKLIGRDESWLLFRRSGTEPIVRVYAESPKRAALESLLRFGVGLI